MKVASLRMRLVGGIRNGKVESSLDSSVWLALTPGNLDSRFLTFPLNEQKNIPLFFVGLITLRPGIPFTRILILSMPLPFVRNKLFFKLFFCPPSPTPQFTTLPMISLVPHSPPLHFLSLLTQHCSWMYPKR